MKPAQPTDWKYSNVTVSHHVAKKLDDILRDYVQTYLLHHRIWLSSAPVARTHQNSWLARLCEDSILRSEQAITDAASTMIRKKMISQNHYLYAFGVLEHSWTTDDVTGSDSDEPAHVQLSEMKHCKKIAPNGMSVAEIVILSASVTIASSIPFRIVLCILMLYFHSDNKRKLATWKH